MMAAMSPQETVERALDISEADGCIVIATEQTEANLRWANNALTTNGEMRSRQLAVISIVNKAEGAASAVVERTVIGPDEIESVVRASETAARNAPAADDAISLIEPLSAHPGSSAWGADPADTSIGIFDTIARDLGAAFARARSEDQLLFGFAEHVMTSTYLGTSTGLRLRHDQPTGRVEMNAKTPDFARSAWVGKATPDFRDVHVAEFDGSLRQRLEWAAKSIELPAGRYDTVLPPSAVSDLMIYLYWTASAREADEGNSVFSRKGGGSRIGERLTHIPLTLRSDPNEVDLRCAPFHAATMSNSMTSVFDNGAPVEPVRWIDNGVLNALIRTRSWASRHGGTPAMEVDNLILEGPSDGSSSHKTLDDMVTGIDRGLLLTCLWYIREVDPQTLLLTGLTRDGVYLIEGGEVVGAVNNFRFNESPVDLLSRMAEIGQTTPTMPREWGDYFTRAAMPSIRIPDFNMSSVSQAS